jgi:hypothetical protein
VTAQNGTLAIIIAKAAIIAAKRERTIHGIGLSVPGGR